MLDGDPLDILAYVDMRDRDDRKDKRRSPGSSPIRQILKARRVGGSIVVSLPKSLRDPLGIDSGDHLMISLDKRNNRLVITKE